MIIHDNKNKLFEINEGENGKCKIKILDYLYFRIFYLQGDRVNRLNVILQVQKVDFKDTAKIKELISKENDADYNWQIEGLEDDTIKASTSYAAYKEECNETTTVSEVSTSCDTRIDQND